MLAWRIHATGPMMRGASRVNLGMRYYQYLLTFPQWKACKSKFFDGIKTVESQLTLLVSCRKKINEIIQCGNCEGKTGQNWNKEVKILLNYPHF